MPEEKCRNKLSRPLAMVLVVGAFGAAACGGSDADGQRLVEERIARERAEAGRIAKQEQRLADLQRQVREADRRSERRSRRPGTPVTPPAAPAPAPPPTESPASPGGSTPVTFHTGVSDGEAWPAAVCRIDSPGDGAGVYCWTPNDGYTVRLDAAGARRLRGDEPGNEGVAPSSYPELSLGSSREAYGYSCTSRGSGLVCTSPDGHGWTLPRYHGLPRFF